MAEFNLKKAGSGLLGLGLAGYNSFTQRPRRSQVDKTSLNMLNMEYKPSDFEGLMAQYRTHNMMPAGNLTYKDLYNPSVGDQFRSMFAAGLGMYGASQGLSDIVRGMDFGKKEASTPPPGFTPGQGAVDNEALQDALASGDREAQMDAVESAMQKQGFDTTNISLSTAASGAKPISPTGEGWTTGEAIKSDYFASGEPIKIILPHGCGGHLHSCGGHKYLGGGDLNVGNMVGSAIDLTNAGLGVILNAAGMEQERRRAEADASKYNFDLQYLRDRQTHDFWDAAHDTKNNMLNMQAIQMRAHGGDLHTQGADFPLLGEYNFIGNGGTHESNPYSGVPQGVASDGQENLVEQNEVVWNDYVFSHRLKVPKAIRQKYKLRDDLFFSDAAEKLIAEAKERPNDPISQNGIEAKLTDLRDAQEDVRMRRQAAKVRRQLAGMSPEELMQIQAMLQQQGGAPMPIEYAALGGQLHKFANGGYRVWTSPKSGQKYKVTQEFLDMLERGNAKVTELDDGTLQITRIKDPYKRQYRYSESGERVLRRYKRKEDGTLEELTGKYENNANFLDSKGNLVEHRMDPDKDPDETAAREKEDLYVKTNNAIKEYIRKKHAGEALTNDDKRIEDKLKEVDNQFTRGSYTDSKRLYDKNGNLRKDAALVLFGKDDTGGLRTDQKWGPNHWSADWLVKPNEEEIEERLPWEFSRYEEEEGRGKEELQLREEPKTIYPTWMRYAPLAAPFLADYTVRDYSTMIPPREVTYRPIGDYLPYNPIDTQRYLTAIGQQDAARRGAITNMTGANRNMAMAQDALAEYQRQQDIANVLNTAEGINFDRRAKVGEFNRGTNMFNAQAFNHAEMANMRVPEFQFHQAANTARMRKAVDDAIDEAKGVTDSTFLDTLHNIGRENFAFNQANNNPALYSWSDLRGVPWYKQQIATENTSGKKPASCGGMLTKRNKGRR